MNFTKSNKSLEQIVEAMKEIVTEKYVSTSLFEKIKNCTVPGPYEIDEEILPYVVVLPNSSEEIGQILKFANIEHIPIFVRGSGTSLTAHSRPHLPGIIINTHRMRNIEIFEDYGFFECQPGITAAMVSEELGKINCFLPIWPGSKLVASIGGLISNNTSGHVVDACMGKPGDYVLGLEVVLPNGEIINTGSKGLRRIAGTDLSKFFIGGDGVFGVITKVRMRLVPNFKEAYGMAVFENLSDLAKGVQRLYRERSPAPLLMEMMAKDVAKIAYEIKGMEPPKGSVVIFVQSAFSEKEALEKVEEVLRCFRAEKADPAYSISDHEAWHKVLGAREVIGPYIMQQDGDIVKSAEVVGNLKDLVEVMEDAVKFNEELPLLKNLNNYLFGHIGGLTLHPTFLIPRTWSKEKKKKAINELFEKETELNLKYDTCGGEWGQFSVRTSFFIQKYGETGYNIVRGLKESLDPNNILNPGILEGYR